MDESRSIDSVKDFFYVVRSIRYFVTYIIDRSTFDSHRLHYMKEKLFFYTETCATLVFARSRLQSVVSDYITYNFLFNVDNNGAVLSLNDLSADLFEPVIVQLGAPCCGFRDSQSLTDFFDATSSLLGIRQQADSPMRKKRNALVFYRLLAESDLVRHGKEVTERDMNAIEQKADNIICVLRHIFNTGIENGALPIRGMDEIIYRYEEFAPYINESWRLLDEITEDKYYTTDKDFQERFAFLKDVDA